MSFSATVDFFSIFFPYFLGNVSPRRNFSESSIFVEISRNPAAVQFSKICSSCHVLFYHQNSWCHRLGRDLVRPAGGGRGAGELPRGDLRGLPARAGEARVPAAPPGLEEPAVRGFFFGGGGVSEVVSATLLREFSTCSEFKIDMVCIFCSK